MRINDLESVDIAPVPFISHDAAAGERRKCLLHRYNFDGKRVYKEARWACCDHVELELPLKMRLETIDVRHSDTVALLRGPLVLMAVKQKQDGPVPKLTREQLLAASERTAVAGELDERAGDDAAVYVAGGSTLYDLYEGGLKRPVAGRKRYQHTFRGALAGLAWAENQMFVFASSDQNGRGQRRGSISTWWLIVPHCFVR